MPDIWVNSLSAVTVPVNVLPLLDDTDFKSIEEAVAYNASGMDLVWNFVTTAGVQTQTSVTPTTGGLHDWSHKGNGIYNIEIPASGGDVNNDTVGFGWFTGLCDGVLPWCGPRIGFRPAALNDKLCDGPYNDYRGLAGTALPGAAADAAGGLPISDAGGLDLDTLLGRITANVATEAKQDIIDTEVGAIKAVTDALPDAGALSDLATILEDTGELQTRLDDMIEADGANWRFTTNALEQGPSGEASTPNLLVSTTVATLASQTSFTLTGGSNDDDAYNGQTAVVYDASDSDYPSVREITDYVGSTKRVTLDSAPDFTLAVGDAVKILVAPPQLDAIQAKTDTIAGDMTVSAPVTQDLDIVIYQYDDYYDAEGRSLEWTNSDGDWGGGDITGATVSLQINHKHTGAAVKTKVGTVVTATGTQKVRVELGTADTDDFTDCGELYKYQLRITLAGDGGHVETVAEGDVTVIKRLAAS